MTGTDPPGGGETPPGAGRPGSRESPLGPKGHEVPEHRVERLLEPELRVIRSAEHALAPAWRRVTQGERPWSATGAVPAAVAMQTAVATQRPAPGMSLPLASLSRVLPVLEVLLLGGLVAANPRRITRRTRPVRAITVSLIVAITLANVYSAARLVEGILGGGERLDATDLLFLGGAVWFTNVIVFALWYWELDRGGPAARAMAMHPRPDFLFPQMTVPDLVSRDWDAEFPDYLYLSFTNASAFSPTDVLPLSRWAKMTMMVQSVVSLATVVLVVARAVNTLGGG